MSSGSSLWLVLHLNLSFQQAPNRNARKTATLHFNLRFGSCGASRLPGVATPIPTAATASLGSAGLEKSQPRCSVSLPPFSPPLPLDEIYGFKRGAIKDMNLQLPPPLMLKLFNRKISNAAKATTTSCTHRAAPKPFFFAKSHLHLSHNQNLALRSRIEFSGRNSAPIYCWALTNLYLPFSGSLHCTYHSRSHFFPSEAGSHPRGVEALLPAVPASLAGPVGMVASHSRARASERLNGFRWGFGFLWGPQCQPGT